MKKFSYAYLKRQGLDAWTNGGRRAEARDEFAARLQDKEVCEQSIIDALMGLELWNNYNYDQHIINKVEIVRSFIRKGIVEVNVYNLINKNIGARIIVTWDPEKDVYSEDSIDLELRIKELESQVNILLEKSKKYDEFLRSQNG